MIFVNFSESPRCCQDGVTTPHPDEGDARSAFFTLVGDEGDSPVIQRYQKFLPRVPTDFGFSFCSVQTFGVKTSRYTQVLLLLIFLLYNTMPWTRGRLLTPNQPRMAPISMLVPEVPPGTLAGEWV